jgi:hypothetical protein
MYGRSFVVGGALILSLVGCGGDGGRQDPETVDVSGTVYLDEKPLANAEVNFVSPQGDFAAYGKTGPDGKFILVPGAVAGKNKVYISKIEGGQFDLNAEEGMDAEQLKAMNQSQPSRAKKPSGPQQVVPEEFSDPAKSQLMFEVPTDGTESADFRL